MRHVLLLALLAGLWQMPALAANPETPADLQRRSLQLKLLQTRARLLREDPDLARRHQEILALYRQLDQALAKHPEIAALQKELNRIDGRTEAQKGRQP